MSSTSKELCVTSEFLYTSYGLCGLSFLTNVCPYIFVFTVFECFVTFWGHELNAKQTPRARERVMNRGL